MRNAGGDRQDESSGDQRFEERGAGVAGECGVMPAIAGRRCHGATGCKPLPA
jgi:hypothetical protein